MERSEFKISEEIKPGKDFYLYSNKYWINNNPLPKDKSRYATFDKLHEENLERLMELIDKPSANLPIPLQMKIINLRDKYLERDYYENYTYFRHNLDIPDYAYMLPDNSGTHLWRNIQNPSEWSYIDELYTTPFTNGAFYHHTNITFPVRRQDPFNKYSTRITVDDVPINNNFEIPATEFDYSNADILTNNESSCF